MRRKVQKVNNKIALAITMVMSTMWCVYAFTIWALLPLAFPQIQAAVFYVSGGVIQLVALPAIMVGQSLMNKSSEKRAMQDHATIMAEMAELKAVHKDFDELVAKLNAGCVCQFTQSKSV